MRVNLVFSARGSKIISNFLKFCSKKEADWSANDFSDSCDGRVSSETLFRVLCSSHHSF